MESAGRTSSYRPKRIDDHPGLLAQQRKLMSKSKEWFLQVRAEEAQQQELADREQHYFGLLLSKDRLGKVKGKHELRNEKQPGEQPTKNK
jgi:hypothetical protein